MTDLVWHNDAHTVSFRVERHQIRVRPGPCPHRDMSEAAPCWHREAGGCLVGHHIRHYDMWGCEGEADVDGPSMRMAWAWSGSEWDIGQGVFYWLPASDERFAGFADNQVR